MEGHGSAVNEKANPTGVEIEVTFIEKEEGFFHQAAQFSLTVDVRAKTLQETLLSALPEELRRPDSKYEYQCFAENFKGEAIDLQQRPLEIQYLLNAVSNHSKPVLYLCRKETGDTDPDTEMDERKPSVVVRSFIDTGPEPTAFRESDSEGDENDPFADIPQLPQPPSAARISRTLPHGKTALGFTFSVPPSASPTAIRRPLNRGDRSGKNRRSAFVQSDIEKKPPNKSFSLDDGATPSLKDRIYTRQPSLKMERTRKKRSPMAPQVELQIETADGSTMSVPCNSHCTIRKLKQAIGEKLRTNGKIAVSDGSLVPLKLTYKVDGKEYELLNDTQFIFQTCFYELAVGGLPIRAHPAEKLPRKELTVLYRISELTGMLMEDDVDSIGISTPFKLARIPKADQEEVQWTRRTLHDYVVNIVHSRNAEEYALSMEVASTETPIALALKIPTGDMIDVIFHHKDELSFRKKVRVHSQAESVLAEIFPSVVGFGAVEDRIGDYTLQVTGEESYIHGQHELMSFKDIRRCIAKGEPLHLSIAKSPSVEMDKPHEFSWPALDPESSECPLHSDVSCKPPICMTEAASIWDFKDSFRITVVEIKDIPLVMRARSDVLVTAILYHGANKLSQSISTEKKPLSFSTIQWNEPIDFEIQKMNIPKAAKIRVTVNVALARKRSTTTGSEWISYWGFVTVNDHMGVLRSGEHEISLWPMKQGKEGGDDVIMPNPAAPASNNPDPKAVKIVIRFDSGNVPIYFPSVSDEGRASLYLQQPAVRNNAVRSALQRLMDVINQVEVYSTLPAYIAKVDWGNISVCLEVYSLLDQLADVAESIPTEVALKLLDADFPDKRVRAFATSILEKLSDEELEDFLLQLTQALKFEPHHDSALARFLLKRALRNKRIGHFFFWYLKCEMNNPLFMPRFGVILEAYLKGCGEAMLTRFKDEVEMQAILEEIGRKLKQEYNDDASRMQAALPEILEGEKLSKFVFIPVYNPRSILGNLRASKCKIMSSKKKPIWLELQNVHPTALAPTPTRLILKMGDDLRQDMITLRMLSLFEKLWEQEGLYLELIPYGCMATGPNTGFIEVVKNAKTISDVSDVSDNKKLYEWIKQHQINEFGEVDPDKVKAAVKRFTHSCAGYSVATYVLGIGDRHNDNIMVNTSGNLFHIDFGHFLGNIKYFMGFKREWAPFVLTPDFVYVMGGEGSAMFETYKRLCCRAFLILRRNANLIINLFSLMRSTGIPELTCVEDTDYIRMAMLLDYKSEHRAEEIFCTVIQKCLNLKWTVQLMWKAHNAKKKRHS